MENYKLSQEAKADLKRIYQYGVREFGVAQADKYFDTLFNRFNEIAENPTHYSTVDHIKEGYRRCPCGSDNIYYHIKDGIVEIMNIIGRQDIEEYLKNNQLYIFTYKNKKTPKALTFGVFLFTGWRQTYIMPPTGL